MSKYLKTKFNKETWGSNRNSFIGCSEVASTFGLTKEDGCYKSMHSLYLEKIGENVPKFMGNVITKEGTRAEKDIVEMFQYWSLEYPTQEAMWANFEEGRIQRKVRKSSFYYSAPKICKHLRGSIDGYFKQGGVIYGVEAKNTTSMVLRNYEKRISPAHYLQCQAYLIVTGWPAWYLCQKVDGQKREVFEILPDLEVQDRIIDRVNEFMARVEKAIETKIKYGIKEYYQVPFNRFTDKQNMGLEILNHIEPDYDGTLDEIETIKSLRKDRLDALEIPGTNELLLAIGKYSLAEDKKSETEALCNKLWLEAVSLLKGADVATFDVDGKQTVIMYKPDKAGRMRKYITPSLVNYAIEVFKGEQQG